MFVDEVTLKIIAGSGGDGCTAFRREKYVPLGGPYGGNGGDGSNVYFIVDTGLHTLLDLRYQKLIKGEKGENGKGKNQQGKNAEDLYIKVPQGTIVTDLDTGLIIADLKEKDSKALIAKGGRGGRGNTAFKTHENTAPNFSENGEPGEVRNLKIELKLLADVGLVGFPSVGKSTFISKVSRAKPKIAAYHFTTLSPNLGVVKARNGHSFVIADLPGLIEGASQGEGLGDQFLRHIERTKVILHVLDISGSEGRNPIEDYEKINHELEAFNPKLLKRPQVVLANKMDLDGSEENLSLFKQKYPNLKIFQVSAQEGKGLQDVIDYLDTLLEGTQEEALYEEDAFESHVLYTFKKEEPFTITKEDDTYVISGDKIEKLFKMTKFSSEEAAYRFANKLRKMGIDDALEKLGIEEGDMVRILDYYFEYRK